MSRSLGEVTKRDFVAIADILCVREAGIGLVRHLAAYFKSQNPRFDEFRFEKAATACTRRSHGLGGLRRHRRRRSRR